jgi:hypothetical protein
LVAHAPPGQPKLRIACVERNMAPKRYKLSFVEAYPINISKPSANLK